MKETLFVLGRTPELGLRELSAIYPDISPVIPGIARTPASISPDEIKHLGGTVKLVELVSEVAEVGAQTLVPLVASTNGGKISFGVSYYGGIFDSSLLLREIKDILAASNISARYVETKDETALSSVQISKGHVVDIVIVQLPSGRFLLGRTYAVQDFEGWAMRDRQKPARDPKGGMLPPKVARMLVNIAQSGSRGKGDRVLYDPFCGTGTILAEALLSGWQVSGSDISDDAIRASEKNLSWLKDTYALTGESVIRLFTGDATHASDHINPHSIDAIVTEPFMGDPSIALPGQTPSEQRVKNIIKGLEKLYLGCFKEWEGILKSRGRIVVAIPNIVIGGNIYSVKNVVDRCESLGYTRVAGPIEYSRPDAVVRRQFYIFQKTS